MKEVWAIFFTSMKAVGYNVPALQDCAHVAFSNLNEAVGTHSDTFSKDLVKNKGKKIKLH
jgi:hypothetical protein